jgi:hypothetical protein
VTYPAAASIGVMLACSQQETELHDITNGCRNVLDKLGKKLEKYRILGSGPATVGKRVEKIWKKLKWEPKDVCELRSRITSNIALLNAFNGRITRDSVDKLIQHKDDQERRTILDWLTPTDYGTQQSDFIYRRQEGTGALNSAPTREPRVCTHARPAPSVGGPLSFLILSIIGVPRAAA